MSYSVVVQSKAPKLFLKNARRVNVAANYLIRSERMCEGGRGRDTRQMPILVRGLGHLPPEILKTKQFGSNFDFLCYNCLSF